MSLIELLVALMLAALLMGLLNSVLNQVQAGWRRSTTIAAAAAEELALAQFLFTSVAAALPPDPLDQKTWFHGAAERIEFLAAGPTAEFTRGPVKMHLYLRQQKDGRKALMLDMRPLTMSSSRLSGVGPRILAEGLASISFDFSDSTGERAQQLKTWNDSRTLPQTIGVSIVFTPERANPLRLVMTPRRTVSGRCVFDLISLSCRA